VERRAPSRVDGGRGRPPLHLLLCAILLAGCARHSAQRSPYASPGPYRVSIVDQEWFDASRSRTVPVRMYVPVGVAHPPIVIFSHGTANGRDGYSWLGSHWASHGFLSVHPEHVGAGRDLERKGALATLVADDDPALHRLYPEDLRFVIDHLGATRVAVAGHSMGAYAALALAGLNEYRDPRVVAAMPISMSEEYDASAYRAVDVPLLNITGTADMSLVYGTLPRHRRIPFESVPGGGDDYLVTIDGGTHSTPSEEETPENRRAHDVIRAATTAFLDAYLRNDRRAGRWLNGGGLMRFDGGDARLEIR
jgi:predicted dienelactone hydrolase